MRTVRTTRFRRHVSAVCLLSALGIALCAGREMRAQERAEPTLWLLNSGFNPVDSPAFQRSVSPAWDTPVAVPSDVVEGLKTTKASGGLTIIPVFDSSINNDPNSAAIKNTINAAIAIYAAKFTDNVTVTISFAEMNTGLGQSSSYFLNMPYSTYIGALKADSKTADDGTAQSHLPSSATNPVNGASTINVKTANGRAIGLNTNPLSGQPDGFIMLNTAITSPGRPGSSGTYDLMATAEHEMDEVLGLSSSLPDVLNGTIFPQDLYRYNQAGARTFTTNNATQAFFSIDGPTRIVQFDNQNDGGDFGDWQSNPRPAGVPPQVQDAFATPNAHPVLGPSEYRSLDVVGYDLITTDPHMSLDGPQNGAQIKQPFNTGGWAVDLAAASGIGVDAVHVWAFPVVNGVIGAGQFVNAALLGANRPDVAAAFGNQFLPSGFNFLMTGLSPGQYYVGVYVRSSVTGTFNNQQFALVTILPAGPVPNPRMSLDGPVNGSQIKQPFNTGGWAVDLGASSGVGVDAIHVWAFPVVNGVIGTGQFVNTAILGGNRADVAAAFGNQFLLSGFNFLMTGLAPGQYYVGVYVHSTVSNAFNQQQFALVTIIP